tara:strand:+ start:383 stop:1786 length:1404 start_codon:yes stop_codon:yes gene_type:complete
MKRYQIIPKRIKLIIGIILSSVAITIYFILSQNPIVSPDGFDNLKLASIINQKSCLSYLLNCTPTTTDQGPFYPLLAVFFKTLNISPIKGLINLQTIMHLLCCACLTLHVRLNYRLKGPESLILFGLSLINPLHLGWQRYIIPDGFGMDIALIVIILLDIFRLTNNYFYLYIVSIIICICSLLRYDIYFLIVPFLFTIYLNYKIVKNNSLSLKKLILVTISLVLISSTFLTFWSIRNIKLSMAPLRSSFFTTSGQVLDPKIIDWIKSWTISTYDLPRGIYPYLSGKSFLIKPPQWATNEELSKALKEDVDLSKTKTAELASKQASLIRSNFLMNSIMNIKRILWITLGPFHSGGLPIQTKSNTINIKLFNKIFIKSSNFIARLIIFFLLVKTYKNISIFHLPIINSAILFLIFDISICLYLGQIEQRYLTDSMIFLQYAILFEFLNYVRFKDSRSNNYLNRQKTKFN